MKLLLTTQCEDRIKKHSWVPNKGMLSIFLVTNLENYLEMKYCQFMAGCPKFKKKKKIKSAM